MRAFQCCIGASASAAEAAHLFSGKFIRTILCVSAALACSHGLIDHAAAQERSKGHEEWIKKALEPPQELVFYPPPPEPPKSIPKLPCPPDPKSLELLKSSLDEWQHAYQRFEERQKQQGELSAKITKLQGELQTAIDQKQSSSQISKVENSLSNAWYLLDRVQKILTNIVNNINTASQQYNELLEKLLNKKCAAPQPQTAPQQPPANPPPAQPPSGGGGRFGPRMLPPSQWLSMGQGAYGGFGLGTLTTFGPNWTTTGVDSFGHSDFVMPDNRAWYSAGFLVAPYVGYQWTFASRWLAGIEGEVGYATNNTTTGVPGVSSAPGDSVNVKEDWEGGVRARLGYAVLPNVVVYGTTGLAVQHIQATVTCSSATPFPCGRFGPVTAFTQTNSPTLPGWTIGAGVEYALTGNLRLRAEYRYSDYGTYNAIYGNPANVAVSSSLRLQTNTALLGLSYAFGAPIAPSLPPLITK